jgi:hypothetical protein
MARKKTTSKKTAPKKAARKKTAPKKAARKKTPRKKATRRKVHHPKVATHGKTAAARRNYIEYRGEVNKLKKEFFG